MQGGPSWVLGRRDDDLLFAWKRLGSFFFFSSRRRETRGRDVRLREFLLRSRALGRRHERERERVTGDGWLPRRNAGTRALAWSGYKRCPATTSQEQ